MSTTVSWSISKHHRKADGTYNAKIRIIHNRKVAYMATSIFTKSVRFKKGATYGTVTDQDIDDSLNEKVRDIRRLINENDVVIGNMESAKDVAEFIKKKMLRSGQDIDFIKFSREYIDQIPPNKNKSFLTTGVNSLCYYIDSMNETRLPINRLTSKFLRLYELWLKSERVVYFKGKDRTLKPITNTGLSNYMSAIRLLFNKALEHYNDYETNDIQIKHNPFKAYKIVPCDIPEKKVIGRDIIPKVYELIERKENGIVKQTAIDAFLLSFFLAGINLIDMYEGVTINNGRIEYNRTKTRDRKRDKSFISIAIPEEARLIIERRQWKGGNELLDFRKRYSSIGAFRHAVCDGMKKVSESVGFKLKFYDARHMFATFARNGCGFPKDDIAVCLTHSSPLSTTELYITPDFSIVDKVVKGVIDYAFKRGEYSDK